MCHYKYQRILRGEMEIYSEVIDSRWNIRAVVEVPKRRSKQHHHKGGAEILYCNTANLNEQSRITDGANGFSH